jgi:ABC-2 type transport system ATP-binding protein
LNEYAETYSTGMLKKLYLLVLLLEKNDILVLDEPFNGLDINAVSYISELIKQLKEQGALILVSSHIVLHLRSISDTLSFLENGKLQFIEEKSEFEQLDKYIENKNLEIFEILKTISKKS